ncbi:hypothetical protein [Gordonia terrae]|uniref:hypothetical protein n=1 Tax=Gordonia terrae TaxID=2055 RepID=UPI0011808B0E|nr:hypothetical protein [Gordonia terrae]
MQKSSPARITSAHIAVLVIGVGGVVFGLYWGATHADEPEIFSPTLIGYVGAVLVLNSGWRLVANRDRSRH